MENGKDKVNEIRFYIRTKPYGFLSNFHRAKQVVCGIEYQTNEHYYQSMKAKDPQMSTWIASCPKAYHSMKAGRSLRPNEMINDWDRIKIAVMLEGLQLKFIQNPDLAKMLLETSDAILIEDSPKDMFWGGKLEGSQNMLGKLLMQVRGELKEVVQ